MSLPGGATCASCALWMLQPSIAHTNRKGLRPGQCRRHPPVITEVTGKLISRWPLTDENDWCGEHAVYEQGDKT